MFTLEEYSKASTGAQKDELRWASVPFPLDSELLSKGESSTTLHFSESSQVQGSLTVKITLASGGSDSSPNFTKRNVSVEEISRGPTAPSKTPQSAPVLRKRGASAGDKAKDKLRFFRRANPRKSRRFGGKLELGVVTVPEIMLQIIPVLQHHGRTSPSGFEEVRSLPCQRWSFRVSFERAHLQLR